MAMLVSGRSCGSGRDVPKGWSPHRAEVGLTRLLHAPSAQWWEHERAMSHRTTPVGPGTGQPLVLSL